MYVRLKAFWKVCRDLAKIDEGPGWKPLDCDGLKGELWMNRAVLAGLGTWRSAEVTAKGRLRKNAMIAVVRRELNMKLKKRKK